MIRLRASSARVAAAMLVSLWLSSDARAQATCTPLPAPTGTVVDVTPAQAGGLQGILDSARPGDTVRLADGVYTLSQTLTLRIPGVTLRSKSGERRRVVLDGTYAIGDVLLLQRSDIVVADLTLTRSRWHLVHVVPDGATLSGTILHNLRAVDGGEQFIKINPDGGQFADQGVIRCSSFEMTDVGRSFVRNSCYTGGIDLHQGRGWQISLNTFSGFWCDNGLSEHAIHAWNGSRDTFIDRNIIVNAARGIGLGLGASVDGRTYDDAPCGGAGDIGHFGGAITNNFVVANDPRLFASGAGFDTGIGLEQSCATSVLHNTIVSTAAPRSSSIEWRFANTLALVGNNLVTHALVSRDEGRATLVGNLTGAPLSLFVDVAAANVHLLPSATSAIDRAMPLDAPLHLDIDGDPRGAAPDVGADEYVPPSPSSSSAFVAVASGQGNRLFGILPTTTCVRSTASATWKSHPMLASA